VIGEGRVPLPVRELKEAFTPGVSSKDAKMPMPLTRWIEQAGWLRWGRCHRFRPVSQSASQQSGAVGTMRAGDAAGLAGSQLNLDVDVKTYLLRVRLMTSLPRQQSGECAPGYRVTRHGGPNGACRHPGEARQSLDERKGFHYFPVTEPIVPFALLCLHTLRMF
jgi:hypothetical protein